MVMACNLCQGDKPFAVPMGDGIGEALMAEHIKQDHGENGPGLEHEDE